MKTITGRFDVKSTPVDADETTKAVGAMRMRFDKVFSGALEGRGIVAFLGVMDKAKGSGGYVGLEFVEAVIDGRTGAFLLQHSCTMTQGKQKQSIVVVPDSGNGDLAGLTGEMKIDIRAGGEHFYAFDYDLP